MQYCSDKELCNRINKATLLLEENGFVVINNNNRSFYLEKNIINNGILVVSIPDTLDEIFDFSCYGFVCNKKQRIFDPIRNKALTVELIENREKVFSLWFLLLDSIIHILDKKYEKIDISASKAHENYPYSRYVSIFSNKGELYRAELHPNKISIVDIAANYTVSLKKR